MQDLPLRVLHTGGGGGDRDHERDPERQPEGDHERLLEAASQLAADVGEVHGVSSRKWTPGRPEEPTEREPNYTAGP